MTASTTIIDIAFYPLTAARRAWLTFVLAVVLSAAEVERNRPISKPTPIVMTIDRPPVRPVVRQRPYRAHYRHIDSYRR